MGVMTTGPPGDGAPGRRWGPSAGGTRHPRHRHRLTDGSEMTIVTLPDTGKGWGACLEENGPPTQYGRNAHTAISSLATILESDLHSGSAGYWRRARIELARQ
jgi:hypothetical protein